MSRWYKGMPSPNPGGKPRSAALVARAVSERTDGGAELVELALAILRGEHAEIKSERSRLWALEWCADRLWGRPAQSLELSGLVSLDERERPPDLRGLSKEELAILAKIGEVPELGDDDGPIDLSRLRGLTSEEKHILAGLDRPLPAGESSGGSSTVPPDGLDPDER